MTNDQSDLVLRHWSCVIRHCVHPLLHEGAGGLELRMVRAAEPLKQAGLGGREDGAGRLQAPEGRFVVDRVAVTYSVDGNVDAKVEGQQVEGGVQDADVRLDSGQDDSRPRRALEVVRD